MVLAHHVILSMYGFWLPNDPRGSWSKWVATWDLFRAGGPATKVADRRSHAWDAHDREQRLRTKRALKRSSVILTGEQARCVALGFGECAQTSRYSIYALAVLPQHIHLVVARHHYDVEQVVRRLKQSASVKLRAEGLHPFQGQVDRRGATPSAFGDHMWKCFIDTNAYLDASIKYVERNPQKEGLRKQKWSCVYGDPPAYPGAGYDDGYDASDAPLLDDRRATHWRQVHAHVATQTLARFGDFERVHGHQIRLQNASGRAWRELLQWRAARRKEKQQAGIEVDPSTPEPTLVDSILAEWDREMKNERQRRWRRSTRDRRRRDVDAAEARADAGEAPRSVPVVIPPTSRPAPQPQAVAMLRRAAGRDEGAPLDAAKTTGTLVRDKPFLRNEVELLEECDLAPWPPAVVAPNGSVVSSALLEYLREYRPDAPELQPRGEAVGPVADEGVRR